MKILSACLVLLLYLISADTASAQDRGEQLFNQTCVACHSIGRGRLVGPDLAGVHSRRSEEWIIQFVQSSTKLIASGDPDAEALFKEYSGIVMPDHAVSADDVRAILGYIARKSPSEVITEETVVSASEPTESNAVLGRDLFVGRVRFEKWRCGVQYVPHRKYEFSHHRRFSGQKPDRCGCPVIGSPE